jgi:hypothetical protein
VLVPELLARRRQLRMMQMMKTLPRVPRVPLQMMKTLPRVPLQWFLYHYCWSRPP